MSPITNQQLFDLLQEVKAQNNAIKTDVAVIKEVLANFRQTIDELENKVSVLETDNTDLRQTLKVLEESQRRNQIVIFGINEEVEDSLERRILDFFSNILLVNIHSQDIDNIYRVGKKDNKSHKERPIVVRFTRFLTKKLIFKNLSKLKGTGFSISHDLTREQQEAKKVLYKFYKLAISKNFEAKILKNQLLVNGEVFTVVDLKEADEITFSDFFINKKRLFRNNSAPTTPISQDKTQATASTSEVTPPPQTTSQQISLEEPKVCEGKKIQQIKDREAKSSASSKVRTRAVSSRAGSISSAGKCAEKKN